MTISSTAEQGLLLPKPWKHDDKLGRVGDGRIALKS